MLDKSNARLILVSLAVLTLGSLVGIIAITLAELAVPGVISQGFTFGLGGISTLATVRAASSMSNPTPVTVVEAPAVHPPDVEPLAGVDERRNT